MVKVETLFAAQGAVGFAVVPGHAQRQRDGSVLDGELLDLVHEIPYPLQTEKNRRHVAGRDVLHHLAKRVRQGFLDHHQTPRLRVEAFFVQTDLMTKDGATKTRYVRGDSIASLPIGSRAVRENGRHSELSKQLAKVAKDSKKFVDKVAKRLERKKPNPDGTIEVQLYKEIPEHIKPYMCHLTLQSELVKRFKGVHCTTYEKNGKKIVRLITRPRLL